jgi:hypothetical protein
MKVAKRLLRLLSHWTSACRVRTIPVRRAIPGTIGSPDDDADTDTGSNVIALSIYGLTDELSKIFFPCKGLWSSVLRQNYKTVHQYGRAKHPSVKATVYCRSMFTQWHRTSGAAPMNGLCWSR